MIRAYENPLVSLNKAGKKTRLFPGGNYVVVRGRWLNSQMMLGMYHVKPNPMMDPSFFFPYISPIREVFRFFPP